MLVNTMKLNRASVGAVLVFCLFLQSCQPSMLISSLEALVNAAEIALPVIGAAAGIPPEVMGGIVVYLQSVDQAIVQASEILAGPGTSAEKSARILAAFASVASGCNCIPTGTPQVVVAVIQAVANAIGRFLANFHPTPGIMDSTPSIKVRGSDRAALSKIRNRAEQNLTNLKALK